MDSVRGQEGGSWLSPFQHHGELCGQAPAAWPRVSSFASLFSSGSEHCPGQDPPGMKPKLVCLSGEYLRAEGEEEECEGWNKPVPWADLLPHPRVLPSITPYLVYTF